MSELSVRHGVCLVAGSYFLPGKDAGKVTNTSSIFAEGQEISRYHKRHLFDNLLAGGYAESRTVEIGDKPSVCAFSGWKIGQSICYDLRFPYHFASLRDQGADLVVCPSAFTRRTGEAHWSILVRARAIENQCYMVAVNQCGISPTGVDCWGHSMLVDPWGEVLLDLGTAPGIGVAEIDLEKVQDCRRKMPVWDHRVEGVDR